MDRRDVIARPLAAYDFAWPMDEQYQIQTVESSVVPYSNKTIMASFREREEFKPHADESLYSVQRSVGRSYSLPMKTPSLIDHRDSGGKRNCDRRLRRRCELYLALTLTSLISISCIASSSSRSGMKTAAISFSSLSFIVTFIMGVGYFSRRTRDILATNMMSKIQHGGRLRRKVTLEKIAISIVMVMECIVSGLVLYPQFDTNPIAVAGNEIWNPNLFYITWFSLYASAYQAANVFYNDGNNTLADTDYQSSMKSSWFMCLFSSTCTATSLLIIQSGPACRGELIDKTTYCSSALAAGSVNVVCAIVLFVCGACYWQSVTIALRLQKLLEIVGATLLMVAQCVVVAIVTTPSGPGHETGNAFIVSWMSFTMSLLQWRNSVESCLMPPEQVRKSASSISKGSVRGETKSTATTEDEGSSYEDRGNSCDYIGEVLTDIPKEVQAGGDDYWNNLRGPDPEEGLRNHSFYNNRRQAQHQAHVDGNSVLEEADDVLLKVASYHCRSYVAKARTSPKSPRDASSSHSISRREDPRGVQFNDSMHRKTRRKSQEHAKEPPSSREEAVARVARPHRPNPSNECLGKQDITFRIPPLPLTSDSCNPPTNQEGFRVRLTSAPKSDPPKTFTPTPPQRRASFVSNMSPLHETSHDGETRRSSSSLSSENGENNNVEHIAGSRITTSSSRSSENRRTPPLPPPPPPPLPRSRNKASRASASKHREKKPQADKEISATKHSSSTGRSNRHNSSSERLFASFPSESPRKSPDTELGSVPFDVMLNDDQTVVTEITGPVTEFRYSIPTGTGDRKLSIAVAAALHAAAVSANTEKKAKASNDVVSDVFNIYNPKRSSRKERSLSPTSQRQTEGQSVSLQSSNMFDGSVGSPMTEDISLVSTLEQARNLRTYSDLEDSKLHIQGENIATNTSGIVGILKHNHDPGSHRKTPSNASSKLSGRASTPSKSSQKRYQDESDLVLRALSARMKGVHTEGASASIQGSVGVNKSLSRRQGSSQQLSHNISNAASQESRSRLASSSAERRGSIKSYFSVMDDSHTIHGEFEC